MSEAADLVDCGTVNVRGIGARRAVWLNGAYFMWDQDALDRKLGLGKYLFSYRPDAPQRRRREPHTDDMIQMISDQERARLALSENSDDKG